jgi:anaerobic dimethyl sulfoxide reductase subunit B (iron-sulfur subunit)
MQAVNDRKFIIDLARCTGCMACAIACKDRANLPDSLNWLRVDAEEGGVYPTPTLTYRVVHCWHCSYPSCVEVCPTNAIIQLANGLLQIDAELCNGCGHCIDACPFTAIVMLPQGVASKCDGCNDELDLGWEPTCVRACPMRALNYEQADNSAIPNREGDQTFNDHGIGPYVMYLRWPGS